MADDADLAQVEIDGNVQRARLTVQGAPRLVATGRCQNCDEALEGAEQLFCDQECEKDFQKRERANALRSGGG
jgi:hypothetical protein